MIKTIITDIEGTTTDIHFVHKVLFPYSREKMSQYINENQHSPKLLPHLKQIRNLMGIDATLDDITSQLIAWIDEDAKIGPLKSIQGLIWQMGFENAAFTGHLYPDAFEMLKLWHSQGIALYVYSSGSVQAQQLLFQYSDFGDLRYLFKGYFDTAVGGKKEVASYRNILESIQIEGNEVLFLSDVVAELDAARENKMGTCLLLRDGLNPQPNGHRNFSDFLNIPTTA